MLLLRFVFVQIVCLCLDINYMHLKELVHYM